MGAGLPQNVATVAEVCVTRQDKEQIAESVEVQRRQFVDAIVIQRDCGPRGALGSPDDSAGNMKQSRARSATGEHEGPQRLQLGVVEVARGLE